MILSARKASLDQRRLRSQLLCDINTLRCQQVMLADASCDSCQRRLPPFFVRCIAIKSRLFSSTSSTHMSAIDVTEYAIGTPTAAARSENGTGAFVGADLTLHGTQIANAEDRGIQAAAATDGGRCPSRAARGATDSAVTDAFEQSPAPPAPTPRHTRAATADAAAAAAEPAAPLTAELMAERAAKMFPADTVGPVASEMGAVAVPPTKELVQLASKVVSEWPQHHVAERSRAYGNFDRVVALGWVVGDALGLPLLERGAAFTLGGAVRKRATKIEAELAAKKKAASRLASKAADAEAQQAIEAAAAAEEAELLAKEVEPALPLPEAAPSPAPRTVICGKRKEREKEREAEQPPSLAELQKAHAAKARRHRRATVATAEANARAVTLEAGWERLFAAWARQLHQDVDDNDEQAVAEPKKGRCG